PQLNTMAYKLIISLAVLATVILADRAPSYSPPPQAPSYSPPPQPSYAAPEGPATYDFNYAVKDDYSGNDFGHNEAREGDYTSGSYYVQLPDGRLQKVTYTVNGDSGYVAEVTYEGEPQYPAAAAPSGYKPPTPGYN
ncbi:unnamed protein product, partial [Meganyctiphanes norvegica]